MEWRKYHEKGINQLKAYLDIQNLNVGYLLVFNFNQNKDKKVQWVNIENKKIFEVMV